MLTPVSHLKEASKEKKKKTNDRERKRKMVCVGEVRVSVLVPNTLPLF